MSIYLNVKYKDSLAKEYNSPRDECFLMNGIQDDNCQFEFWILPGILSH